MIYEGEITLYYIYYHTKRRTHFCISCGQIAHYMVNRDCSLLLCRLCILEFLDELYPEIGSWMWKRVKNQIENAEYKGIVRSKATSYKYYHFLCKDEPIKLCFIVGCNMRARIYIMSVERTKTGIDPTDAIFMCPMHFNMLYEMIKDEKSDIYCW
ncbi:MAG: hypothetical protein ACTSRA_00675 [Promethearchaeota archaeon]